MSLATSDWGLAGVEALRDRVSVLVIVDVLSFCTAVDVAVARGAVVYPFPYGAEHDARVAADRVGAVLAGPRSFTDDGYSLSPESMATIPNGLRLMLPSPNGSRLSLAGGDTPVMAGCLRNAATVAEAARRLAGGGAIGVIPAGERWPDGSLRPAIEDLLGAGAILHHLDLPCSPEARIARDAWLAAAPDLSRVIRGSMSGLELIEGGFPGDVDVALKVNVSTAAPRLANGAYRRG